VNAWINTGGHTLDDAQLRGHVVLVDFWTYSCINCQRAIPHVEAWYQRYRLDGLIVLGVHSPEFACEGDVNNVRKAVRTLHVTYPVPVDDSLANFAAFANNSWPAEYLIDASGIVRHIEFGEGNYSRSEDEIRQLLRAARPTVVLPARTDIADTTPTLEQSPESYLGSQYPSYSTQTLHDSVAWNYVLPASEPIERWSLGGTWSVDPEEITAGPRAQLRINFLASRVFLVVGGHGTITVDALGHRRTIAISGYPRLYTMVSAPSEVNAIATLSVSPGVRCYDFTFG
jgi:thiol-disulfide isomerase/thioredoxin